MFQNVIGVLVIFDRLWDKMSCHTKECKFQFIHVKVLVMGTQVISGMLYIEYL